MQRFRGGLAFEAHRLLYHSTLGLRVIKKKKKHVLVGRPCRSFLTLFGYTNLVSPGREGEVQKGQVREGEVAEM